MVLRKKQSKSSIKTILKKIAVKQAVKKISKIKKPLISKKKFLNIKPKKKLTKKKVVSSTTRLKGGKKIENKKIADKEKLPIKLKRVSHNPIISPTLYEWESKATFNPAAFVSDDKIHILYRAIGDDDSSVLGYATSLDGINIDDRPTYCIYKRRGRYPTSGERIDYISGGGWSGGCEDPRLTLIDDTLYLIYTAFDGWGSVRMAMTSILLSDFKKKKWSWKNAVFISPPGEMNKNWVIFPEKINGKFAIMHSFYPNILIDYFDSLDELDGKKFIKSNNKRPVDENRTWDSWFRGVGPTPIKTKDGWLILYHAMDHRNPDRYRMGALLLDLENPTRVLYRSKDPILEPEEDYENNGHKWGVVYSCGAVVKNGELYVYYGGADKFVCVASIGLQELIDSMKEDKIIKLKNIKEKKNI